MSETSSPSSSSEEIRDSLPDDLNASEFVGPYQFPDNSRRRTPGYIYLAFAAACFALWITHRDGEQVLINNGIGFAALLLGAFGLLCLTSGWRMKIDEKQALVAATGAVGFAVGHASAQQVWRGFRSRPTWRVLCYSSENPPQQRGLVLVDAVDGSVIEHMVQENPETDWREPTE
ncbi:MAG: hypothetical protein NTX77_08960 [Actinobacteria bacterium]|nr:hypothetical protein [Actinomycetota bacterium]